jgi:hypothetical protein
MSEIFVTVKIATGCFLPYLINPHLKKSFSLEISSASLLCWAIENCNWTDAPVLYNFDLEIKI